ncbi:MAG: Mth938-like domain-containing protein [Rhodanobacter sp.]
MDLSLERPEGYLFVRRVGFQSIVLADRELDKSFLLTTHKVVENWPVDSARQLDENHVDALLSMQPELVILGTGGEQTFPAAAFMAGFLRKGVGIEVMDNAAAARTYNLLVGEGRHVVAAFILPAAA